MNEFGKILIIVERLNKDEEVNESIVLEYDEEKLGYAHEWYIPIETILRFMGFYPETIDTFWKDKCEDYENTKNELDEDTAKNDFQTTRKLMKEAFEEDSDLFEEYVDKISALLYDTQMYNYGKPIDYRDQDNGNTIARKILNLIVY